MTRGLRPAETAEFDGWLLRADHGLARRANSVLPLRRPGVPLDEALTRARDWYAARGLPLVVALPTEARRLLDAELAELGWPAEAQTHILVARVDRLAADGTAATVDPLPADDWMARYQAGEGERDMTRALLTRHDSAGFARIDDARGVPVAIGRGVVDDGWFGVSGVQVAAHARGGGLARRVMAALAAWAGERGATRSYLQVFVTNEAAITLYRDLGYWHHHDYHYRREPTEGTVRREPTEGTVRRGADRRRCSVDCPHARCPGECQAARHLLHRGPACAGVPARRGRAAGEGRTPAA